MAVQIERMKADDVAAVAAIEGPTRLTDEQLRAELERPWARSWVARETEHGVVAFLVAWHVADEMHLLNVATRADRQRRGIGRAILEAFIAHAREVRARHVLLEVRRSNGPAIALYRTLGFFAMGVRARYYPDDEDAIEMVLAFDAVTGEIVPRTDEVRLHG
jgi:[ribosomal protein S18]-alanine N-acetyltransferase